MLGHNDWCIKIERNLVGKYPCRSTLYIRLYWAGRNFGAWVESFGIVTVRQFSYGSAFACLLLGLIQVTLSYFVNFHPALGFRDANLAKYAALSPGCSWTNDSLLSFMFLPCFLGLPFPKILGKLSSPFSTQPVHASGCFFFAWYKSISLTLVTCNHTSFWTLFTFFIRKTFLASVCR